MNLLRILEYNIALIYNHISLRNFYKKIKIIVSLWNTNCIIKKKPKNTVII